MTVPIPDGYKLSAEAPLVTLVETDPANLLAAEARQTTQSHSGEGKTFLIRVPLAEPLTAGAHLNAKVSLSAFVCLPNSLCTVKNFVWTVPINVYPGSTGPIKLTAAK